MNSVILDFYIYVGVCLVLVEWIWSSSVIPLLARNTSIMFKRCWLLSNYSPLEWVFKFQSHAMLLPEVGAAVSILLGFAPLTTLSADSSSKVSGHTSLWYNIISFLLPPLIGRFWLTKHHYDLLCSWMLFLHLIHLIGLGLFLCLRWQELTVSMIKFEPYNKVICFLSFFFSNFHSILQWSCFDMQIHISFVKPRILFWATPLEVMWFLIRIKATFNFLVPDLFMEVLFYQNYHVVRDYSYHIRLFNFFTPAEAWSFCDLLCRWGWNLSGLFGWSFIRLYRQRN